MADRHGDIALQALFGEHGIDIASRIALHRDLKVPKRKIAVEIDHPVEAGMIAPTGADEVLLIEQFFAHMRGWVWEVARDQFGPTIFQHGKPDAATGVANDKGNARRFPIEARGEAWQQHEGCVVG